MRKARSAGFQRAPEIGERLLGLSPKAAGDDLAVVAVPRLTRDVQDVAHPDALRQQERLVDVRDGANTFQHDVSVHAIGSVQPAR
jgi:hypothetical protein